MENSYQLYRTNILLGGQMKYDLIINKVDGKCVISDIHISPVVDNLAPYNKVIEDNLLNYSHQENIKNFYQLTQGNFYNTFIDTKLAGDYPLAPIDSSKSLKNYDDSTFMGCRRLSYETYQKQYQIFLPIWVEKNFEDIYFRIILKTKSGLQILSAPIVFDDRIKKYFKDYLDFIHPDDKLIKIDLDGDCTIHGLNVSTGNMSTFKDYGLVENLTYRERPELEFNSLIINSLKNRTTIAKQLFNFNLCFNIDDLITSEELTELDYCQMLNISGNVYIDQNKLPLRDFFTNFEKVDKENVSIINVAQLSEGVVTYNQSPSNDQNINVFSYKDDHKNIDIINANKIDQKYIHWSLCDNNEYIFNLYDGWSGLYMTSAGPLNFSHTYKSAPYTDLEKDIQNMNIIYWCNYIYAYYSSLQNLNGDLLLNASNRFDAQTGYMNYMKYEYTPNSQYDYNFLQICSNEMKSIDKIASYMKVLDSYQNIDQETGLSYTSHLVYTILTENGKIFLCKRIRKKEEYYLMNVSVDKNDLAQKNVIKILQNTLQNAYTDEIVAVLQEYIKILQSAVKPKTIIFNKSIIPIKCGGPEINIEENKYYKIDKNYHQYLFRYDGYIKPTFIDPSNLHNEINYIYYKDSINNIIDTDYGQQYIKYLRGDFPPKYPSINYYSLTSKPLEYALESADIETINIHLLETRWFNDSWVIYLPDEINLPEDINDGSKTAIQIFKEYLKKYLKEYLETYFPAYTFSEDDLESSVEYIFNLYELKTNIDLDEDYITTDKQLSYKYIISAKLK